MEYVLKTVDLTKGYKGQLANDKLNMHIKPGDIYGLVGENGAGKTTLIRMILGLASVTEGEICLFDGEEPVKARKKISGMIEAPAIDKNLSAKDNLTAYSKLYGKDTEKAISGILEKVGLDQQGKKKVRFFSLGMKQRLGIAIALLDNPQFLILDEPMNGLDPMGMREMRTLLTKLNEEDGVTILISSHILGELSKMANCYGILHKGKLVEEITKEDMADKWSNEEEMEQYFLRQMGGSNA